MGELITASTLEFLTWVASRRRTYAEAMEAWRTSCPRFSVWEDSDIARLVSVFRDEENGEAVVVLTDRGRAIIESA